MLIYPGIGIDIPVKPGEKRSDPEGTYKAVMAAKAGGARGVILSRKYSEMVLDNLKAAGDAVKEWAKAP